MADNENNSEETEEVSGFSVRLSRYFYGKIHGGISNDNDFTNDELNTYNLSVTNDKIDISTTGKLIRYLKALILKSTRNKLDAEDYIVDNALSTSSENPIANNVVSERISEIVSSISNKSNLNHTHEMTEINSLNRTFDNLQSIVNTKAQNSDLLSHTSNKNNPHEVTLEQLGVEDSGWDLKPYTSPSSVKNSCSAEPQCRTYGKIVVLSWNTVINKNYGVDATVFTLKNEYKPAYKVISYAMNVRTGTCTTFVINGNGEFFFHNGVSSDTTIRVYCVYIRK